MTITVDDQIFSTIASKEKELTNESHVVESGPTAAAQNHQGEPLTGQVISDIAKGENRLHPGQPTRAGGPVATAQSMAASVSLFPCFT